MAHSTPSSGAIRTGTNTRSVLDFINFAKGGVANATPKTLSNTKFSTLKEFWRTYMSTANDPNDKFPNNATSSNQNIRLSHFTNAQYFEMYMAVENYDAANRAVLSAPPRNYQSIWKAQLFFSLKQPNIGSGLSFGNATYTEVTQSEYLFNSSKNNSIPHYIEITVKSNGTAVGKFFKGTDAYDYNYFKVTELPITGTTATIKPADVLGSLNHNDLAVTWVYPSGGTYTITFVARSYNDNTVLATGDVTVYIGTGPTESSYITGTTSCCTNNTVYQMTWPVAADGDTPNTQRSGWPSDWSIITLGPPCVKMDNALVNCTRKCGPIINSGVPPTQ